MKIGIYGGTFDPIHCGHLILARDAMETLGLDKMIFIPAKLSPHKEGTNPVSAEVRYEMVVTALEGEPGFEACDFEIRGSSPSYTIETLRMLQEKYAKGEFFLLMGADNLPELGTWKEIDAVRQMAQIVVLGRGAAAVGDYPVIPRRIDISSTEIRMRIAKGLSIRYLVPEKIWHVLENKKLYRQ
ncbi:MAG: nicotinate-nucleotide adenylyltransferase [Chthoniobacterales bacterium]